MSLAETKQIIADLQEIMALLEGFEVKTQNLQQDLPQTKSAIITKRELFRLVTELNQTLALMGVRELNEYIGKIQSAIFFTNILLISARAFERGTVVGNLIGIASIASAVGSVGMLEGY